MHLDAATLTVTAVINLAAISVALPLVMGHGVTRAARFAQAGLAALALGLGAMAVAGPQARFWPSVLAMVGVSTSLYLQHRALGNWLGRRPMARLMPALAVAVPLGYALGFDHAQFRAGWANFLLALMMLGVARATLVARRPSARHWRILMLACFLVLAVFTAGRGVMGVFFAESYPNFHSSHPVNIVALVVTNVAAVLNTVAILVAWRDETEDQLRELATHDGLTGVLNRRAWTERAEALFANAKRYRMPLTVFILDMDHFKRINDTHGHDAGDRALQLFARLLRDTRRTGDLVGRMGGEEFCVLLPNTQRSAARGFDLRLRTQLGPMVQAELGFPLDFSAGVAMLRDADATLAGLLARADSALYQAKREGRGHMVFSVGGVGDTVI